MQTNKDGQYKENINFAYQPFFMSTILDLGLKNILKICKYYNYIIWNKLSLLVYLMMQLNTILYSNKHFTPIYHNF